jgi:hypothetical protein
MVKQNDNLKTMIVGGLLVGASIVGGMALGGVGPFSTTGGDDGNGASITTSELIDSQSLSIVTKEKYNPTTSVTATCTVFEDSNELSDTDCTFTINRGLPYKVLVNASGYVAEVIEFEWDGKAPKGAVTLEMGDIMTLSNVISVLNKDGSDNTDSAEYAIGTSEAKNIKLELSGSSKDVYPGGVIVFEAVKSNYSDVDFNLGSAVDTPNQFTASSTGVKVYAFEFPAIDSLELKEGIISVTAEDGVNPTADISYTIYDKQFYEDSLTGQIAGPGIEDSDDSDIGESAVTGTVYLE